jgi:hypothetical protein
MTRQQNSENQSSSAQGLAYHLGAFAFLLGSAATRAFHGLLKPLCGDPVLFCRVSLRAGYATRGIGGATARPAGVGARRWSSRFIGLLTSRNEV